MKNLKIDRKNLLLLLCLSAAAVARADIGDVRLKGWLGERLDRMIERHVGGTDVAYITAPFRVGLVDGQRMEAFASVRTPSDDFWMTFSGTVPIGSHHENPEGANPVTVFFCDYASAGNTWRRDDFYRTWFPIERGPESRYSLPLPRDMALRAELC